MIIQPKPPPELKISLLLRQLNTPPSGRNDGPNKKGNRNDYWKFKQTIKR